MRAEVSCGNCEPSDRLVKAKQDGSVGVDDLAEVTVRGTGLLVTEQRLIPREAARNVADANDRPSAFTSTEYP